MLPAINEIGLSGVRHEVFSVSQMTDIRQREEITGQVLALGKPGLVNIQDIIKLCFVDFNNGLIGTFAFEYLVEEKLRNESPDRWIVVLSFYLHPLLD
ncbi:hypothetical protein Mapa_000766 [Marchantia paleacea]|nr:hypothetical protein Mapa_000766 [Marchantia paleacea]